MKAWDEYKFANTVEEAQIIQETLLTKDIPEESQNSFKRLKSLMRYAAKCNSVKEIGIFQGSSLMAMMTQDSVKQGVGIDINLTAFNAHLKPLLTEYCSRTGKTLKTHGVSSLDKSTVSPVDMLHIDSLHKPEHLKKELQTHHESVWKYIAFHDIKQNDWALLKVIEDFCSTNFQWSVVERLTGGGAGHAVIARNATEEDMGEIQKKPAGPTKRISS
jgi:hypothetical protein|tara:strand:+ start:57 stop:707 length:651 start_codon:yes stop_codon:yes gene_type:complete